MPKQYLFEGALRTVAEIRLMIPVLSEATVRKHLNNGDTTRQQMMARDTPAKRQRSAKKGSRIARANGFSTHFKKAGR